MVKSSDFKFWEEKLPINHRNRDEPRGDVVELEAQSHIEDHFEAYSPPLWTRTSLNFGQETSTLLPQNHHCSCFSPTSRVRAILDGRREIMEMIKGIPESSYELSLKDIVDDQQNVEGVQDKAVTVAEEKKVKHKTENRIQKKMGKNTKSGQIYRSESMESEVFLLKMFLPVSRSFNKKTKTRKSSDICRGQSSERSEKQGTKDWWKMIFLAAKDNQNSTKTNSRISDISGNRNRYAFSDLWSYY